jgi:hypothetical protein
MQARHLRGEDARWGSIPVDARAATIGAFFARSRTFKDKARLKIPTFR